MRGKSQEKEDFGVLADGKAIFQQTGRLLPGRTPGRCRRTPALAGGAREERGSPKSRGTVSQRHKNNP